MRKILFSLICVLLLCVSIGRAEAEEIIYAVYNNTRPDIPDTPTIAECKSSVPSTNLYSTIQDAVNQLSGLLEPPPCPGKETIVICPSPIEPSTGEPIPYSENTRAVLLERCDSRQDVTIKSYTNNPEDVIVQAADTNNNVFYWAGSNANGITVSGLTIKGATGDNCSNEHGIIVPCAGIRIYCVITGYINNNIIKGNNHGIIIKDTAPQWEFLFAVENNELFENNVGIHLRYGNYTYIWHNWIHHNTKAYGTEGIGIKLIDTWRNKIVGNDIEFNDTGIKIANNTALGRFNIGEATAGNIIHHNNIENNTTQFEDDAPDPVFPGIITTVSECLSLPTEADCDLPNPPSACNDPDLEEKRYICDQCSDEDNDGDLECQHYWYEPNMLRGNYWSSIGNSYDYYPLSSPYIYDNDLDNDGINNHIDNCPNVYNPNQADSNNNGRGDECDACLTGSPLNEITDIRQVGRYYQTLYDALYDNGRRYSQLFIQSRAGIITGDLDINLNDINPNRIDKVVRWHAGFDCNYTINHGTTKLRGELRVSDGSLTIKSGALKITNSN